MVDQWSRTPMPGCWISRFSLVNSPVRTKNCDEKKSFQSISQETYEKVSLFLLVCLPVRNPSGCEIGFSLTASPEYRLPSPGGAGGHLVQLFLLNLYKFEV